MDSQQDQQELEVNIFDQFGNGQISDLIDQFYHKVLFDPSLRGKFLKADMTRVRLQQKTYFSRLFGCPFANYQGRDLIEVHKDLGVTNDQFDKFIHHLKQILADMGKEEKTIAIIIKKVQSQRHLVVFEKSEKQEIQQVQNKQ